MSFVCALRGLLCASHRCNKRWQILIKIWSLYADCMHHYARICNCVYMYVFIDTVNVIWRAVFPNIQFSAIYFVTLHVTDCACFKKKKEWNESLIQVTSPCNYLGNFSVKSVYFNSDTNVTRCAGFQWMQSGGLKVAFRTPYFRRIPFSFDFNCLHLSTVYPCHSSVENYAQVPDCMDLWDPINSKVSNDSN